MLRPIVLPPTLLILSASSCLLAQGENPFNRPPAAVDEALRARITAFYQLHVKGDFRHAEAYVAEDTKDFFYTNNKPQYLSFEVSRIDYSENFTRAKATVLCEQYIMIPGFTDKPLKVPIPSTWKVVDGEWYWFVDQEALRNTPWGKSAAGKTPTAPPGGASAGLPAIPNTYDFLFSQMKLDKQSVTLAKEGDAEQVTVVNGAPGIMNISLSAMLPGVEGKLDRTSLKAGDKAVLTLKAGSNAKAGIINIVVEQTGQFLPVQINLK